MTPRPPNNDKRLEALMLDIDVSRRLTPPLLRY